MTRKERSQVPARRAEIVREYGPFAGADHAKLVVAVPAPLPAGTYTVNWHALATDGHKTTGHYVFTVK